jgi:hypothetical protein
MTDRIHALMVVLDSDLRIDDAEPLMAAIRQLRGVWAVQAMETNPGIHAARVRIRLELSQKLWDVLKEDIATY